MNLPAPSLILGGLLTVAATSVHAQEPASQTTPETPWEPVPARLQNVDEVKVQLEEAYPAFLAANGRGGFLRLSIFVNEAGDPDTVHVVSSTGFSELDNAVRTIISRATFSPAEGPDGPLADWLEFPLHFGEREPQPERELVVEDREAALRYGHDHYPHSLRATDIRVQVPVTLIVDGTGRVVGRTVPSACFDDAEAAAREVADMLRFEAATGDAGHRFLSGATVTFAGDTVSLRVRGDTVLAKPPPRDRSEATTSTRPRLRNTRTIQRALQREYPRRLRGLGIGGTVNVWLFVGTDGRVKTRQVNRSSGACELDHAALSVAREMRYEPATVDGEPVEVWVALDLTFTTN